MRRCDLHVCHAFEVACSIGDCHQHHSCALHHDQLVLFAQHVCRSRDNVEFPKESKGQMSEAVWKLVQADPTRLNYLNYTDWPTERLKYPGLLRIHIMYNTHR